MKEIIVKLPNGNELEVSATPEFLEVVKNHFNLSSVDQVDNDHIRLFIYGSTKSAFEKSENENSVN